MKIIKKSLILASLLVTICIPAYADKKIAVLPFDIPNEQQEMKQFSYGTMAVLNHTLSTFPDFIVIDRGKIESILKEIGFQKSTFTDESTSIKIGKISGVDILLLGTIQVSNKIYRVNVNVTDVETGKILKTFQVTGSDMFQVQDQLGEQLISLSSSKEILLAKKADPQAYSFFIQAQENLNELNLDNVQNAINFFDKSLAIDNKYSSANYGKLKAMAMMAYLLKEENKDYNSLLSTLKGYIATTPDSDKENTDFNFAKYFFYKLENNLMAEKETTDKLIKIAKNDYVNVITALGSYYATNHNYDKSESLLQEAIKIDPDNIYSYLNLANNYSHKNMSKEAIDAYDKILKINPNFVIALISKGNVYLLRGKYDLAQKLYENAIKIEPDSAIAHFSLGQVYNSQGKIDLALEELQKTINLNKDFSYAYDKIAEIYTNQKKYPQALEYYNKSLDLEPNKSHGYQRIGSFYAKQNNYSQAIINYNKALEINPKNPFVHAALGEAYTDLGKIDQAIFEHKEAVRYAKELHTGSLPFLYTALGDAYQKAGKYDEALEAYLEGNKTDKADEELYISIGAIYQIKNNYALAIDTYNQLLKINPDSDDAYYGIAETYYGQKDYTQTLKYLDILGKMITGRYIKQEMQNLSFNTYMNIGISSYSLGKTDEAIEYYNQALKIKPDVNIYNNLGVAYYTKAKYQEAIAEYKKALALKPDHADSHNNLGLTYQVLGNLPEAELEYKKACDLGLKSSCK